MSWRQGSGARAAFRAQRVAISLNTDVEFELAVRDELARLDGLFGPYARYGMGRELESILLGGQMVRPEFSIGPNRCGWVGT